MIENVLAKDINGLEPRLTELQSELLARECCSDWRMTRESPLRKVQRSGPLTPGRRIIYRGILVISDVSMAPS